MGGQESRRYVAQVPSTPPEGVALPYRSILAALTAVAAALPAASAVAADACPVQDAGRVCAHVQYAQAPDGTPTDLRLTATLVEPLERCPEHLAARRVTVRRDGRKVGAATRAGSCRDGVARWRAVFSPSETDGWDVKPGAQLETRWNGTKAKATVTIFKTKPERGRLQPRS
jgi:hypothetical protein